MLENIEMYILIFFTYSFAGWFMESVGGILNVKKFVNRGFMIGPYCPVYGIGVVLVSILLKKYINDIPVLFFLSIMICGALEYFTSYIMEKLFNARWWDYHNKKFNINGRICLETLLPFGIAATIILAKINPFLINLYSKLPDFLLHIITGILSVSFIVDFIISFKIILSFKGEIYSKKDNTEEISEMVKEKTEEITDVVKDKAEDVLMKAESDVRYYGRKLRVKAIRKTRYTGYRLAEMMEKTPSEIAIQINNRIKVQKNNIKEKIEKETEKINNEIKLKRAEFEMKQKETKEIIENFKKNSNLRKRLIEAFPSLEIKGKKSTKK